MNKWYHFEKILYIQRIQNAKYFLKLIELYFCFNQRTGNVFNCNCNTGWTGTKCDVDIDECANGPCLNAGTCVNNAGSYICTCTDSYTGINCEDAQECKYMNFKRNIFNAIINNSKKWR